MCIWKWFTNNQGNNPGNDIWSVDVTYNGGNSWVSLESTNATNTFWDRKQFVLNDYISALLFYEHYIINDNNYNNLQNEIDSKTGIIMPVHLFGNVFDVNSLKKKISSKINIIFIYR